MTEDLILTAFVMGLISAASLPLGTLTTLIWKPGDRAIGVLMAFGAGALLAALTIDLVGSALAKGHFNALAVGCVLGGFIFFALDDAVNRQGGFLRKSSTVVQYLRRRERRRFKAVLNDLERMDIFADLAEADIEELAQSVVGEDFAKGATIYGPGDPADYLYIIERGEVTLTDPAAAGRKSDIVLGKGASFGRRAFLTGAPHVRDAVATKDTLVWMLAREDFDRVLEQSHALAEATETMISGSIIGHYLTAHYGLSEAAVEDWRANARASLRAGGNVPNAVTIEHRHDALVRVSDGVRHMPIFQGLPTNELKAVAERLIDVPFERGDTLFRHGDPADRMFILEEGEVALIDPTDPLGMRITVDEGDAFGARSFITAARRSNTAIATDDCSVWVLRKADFDVLLRRFPHLLERVKSYLEDDEVTAYLEHRQGIDAARVARWLKRAMRNVNDGRLIPSAADMAQHVGQHGGAPMAIWLGIMLDGVPESLVIGASLITQSTVSLSLMAGLFLSNYPEALSSSVGMRQQGMSFARVLLMWSSLTLITGIGAALGNVFFVGADPHAFALVEGIAAGAMLTMIAQTMAPEAYMKGGSVVGLATLGGFLTAIFFKTLE
jgi:CRP-like cAMP-binding protein